MGLAASLGCSVCFPASFWPCLIDVGYAQGLLAYVHAYHPVFFIFSYPPKPTIEVNLRFIPTRREAPPLTPFGLARSGAAAVKHQSALGSGSRPPRTSKGPIRLVVQAKSVEWRILLRRLSPSSVSIRPSSTRYFPPSWPLPVHHVEAIPARPGMAWPAALRRAHRPASLVLASQESASAEK